DSFRLLQATELVRRARELEDDLRLSVAVLRMQVALAFERARKVVPGDVRGESAVGDLGRDAIVVDRFLVDTTEVEVTGERVDRGEVGAAHRFEGFAGASVEETASTFGEVRVGLVAKPVLGEREEFPRPLEEETLADETVDGLGKAFLVLAARPQQDAEGELRAEDGRDVERSIRLLVERRKARSRSTAGLARGGHPAVELLEEERVPAGLGVAPSDLLGRELPRRVAHSQIVGDLSGRHRAEDDPPGPGGGLEPLESRPARFRERGVRTAGREDPQGAVLELVREELDRAERRLVRPVQVLEDEHRGAATGELEELFRDPGQDPLARHIAPFVGLAEDFEEPLFDADGSGEGRFAEARGEADEELVAADRGGVLRPKGRVVVRALDRGADERERRRVVERLGPADHHADPAGSDVPDQLRDQRRLPDPCPPHEEGDSTRARPCVLKPTVKRFDRLHPADERATGPGFGRHRVRSSRWGGPSIYVRGREDLRKGSGTTRPAASRPRISRANAVPGDVRSSGRYARAIPFPKVGEWPPLVASVTGFPFERIGVPWRGIAPASATSIPTSRRLRPSVRSFSSAGPPTNTWSKSTNRSWAASSGVWSRWNSCPERRYPFSRRRVSRAPRPTGTTPAARSRSASASASAAGTKTSNPSSPV